MPTEYDIEQTREQLLKAIDDHNDLPFFKSHGFTWEEDVQKVYDQDRPLMINIYLDYDYRLDLIYEPGEWNPDMYIDDMAEKAAIFGEDLVANGYTDDPYPLYLDFCS
jgi:hypothetical protein